MNVNAAVPSLSLRSRPGRLLPPSQEGRPRHAPPRTVIAAAAAARSLAPDRAVRPFRRRRRNGLGAAGRQLRWSPSARTDGLRAFETIEDDRAGSHPAGNPRIRAEGDDWRPTMHTVDRDTGPDRRRQEATGCRCSRCAG